MSRGPHGSEQLEGTNMPGQVIIRPAAFGDAAGIAAVHIATWRSTYRGLMPDAVINNLAVDVQQERWEESLSHPKRTNTIVAKQDGRVVAFASFGPEPGNDYHYQGELYAIYVLEAYQGQGIGTRLLRQSAVGLLEHHLPNMMAWVLSLNPARRWYEKRGGQYLRERVVEFGGQKMNEAAYGWPDLSGLVVSPRNGTSHPT